MPTPPQTKPATPSKTTPDFPCVVTSGSTKTDGILVTFRIDSQTWSRLSRKMGTQDPATFLWENILHRAIEGSAY